MMKLYTKKMLGAEMILKLESDGYSVEGFAQWADHLFHQHRGHCEEGVEGVLQDISVMTFGNEFEMDEDKLRKLATDLIIDTGEKEEQNRR